MPCSRWYASWVGLAMLGINLHLVQRDGQAGVLDQPQVGRFEVGDAPGPDGAVINQVLQPFAGFNEPALGWVGPVNQEQVQVVGAEPLHRLAEGIADAAPRCARPVLNLVVRNRSPRSMPLRRIPSPTAASLT